jgi:hypothetical protein
MVFETKIYKSGKHWIAEVPELDAITQGHSKKGAMKMVRDWVESSLNGKVDVAVHERTNKEIVTVVEATPRFLSFFLQRQRLKGGLSIRAAAKRAGFKSHNAYAQYESGKRIADLAKVQEFVEIFNPSKGFEVRFG